MKPFLQIRCEFKSETNAINLRCRWHKIEEHASNKKGGLVNCSTAEPLNVSRFE